MGRARLTPDVVMRTCAPDTADDDRGTLQANEALVRRLFEDGINQGNMDLLDELLSPDFVYHGPPGDLDLAGAKEMVAGYLAAFPGLGATIDAQIAERNLVVTRFTIVGTHTGDMPGIPATGREMTVTALSMMRIEDGQIVEEWENFDEAGMLRQLGVLPDM